MLWPDGSIRVLVAMALLLLPLYWAGTRVVGETGIGLIVAACVVSVSGVISSVVTGLAQGRYLALEDVLREGQQVEFPSLSPNCGGTVTAILPRVVVVTASDGTRMYIPHTVLFATTIRILSPSQP